MDLELLGLRARQARAVAPPMVRAVRWPSVVIAGSVAAVIVTLLRLDAAYEPTSALRSTAVLLAVGAAFMLDDPAYTLTASQPATLRYRRSLRVALTAVVVGIIWTALALYASWGAQHTEVARATLELTALVGVTLLFAALAGRFRGDDRGGRAAGPAMLATLVVVSRLPQRWTLLVDPSHSRWDDAGRDLIVIACIAFAGLLVVSFDPARRRLMMYLRVGRTAAAGVGVE